MKKFTVKYDENKNIIKITNNKTGKINCYSPVEFIYGQPMYADKTDNYPNYVHKEVWRQYDRS